MDHPVRVRALNAVYFPLGWLACVWGASAGRAWVGAAAGILLLGACVYQRAHPRRELRRLAAVGLLGAAVESAALASGLYGYAGGWGIWWLAPAWVVVLWLLLAATFDSPLRALDRRPFLAATAGAAGGALSFALAAKMGAASFIAPTPVGLAAVALLWAAALPLALAVSRLVKV